MGIAVIPMILQQKINSKKNKAFIFIGIFLFVIIYFVVFAKAQTLTQGYQSNAFIQRGMIIILDKDNPNFVQPATQKLAEKLQGVVVNPNDSTVLLGSDNEKVYVASGGRFKTLVSDQNGPIAVGDYITVSAVDGIGMKATADDPVVLGKAIEPFDPTNADQIRSVVDVRQSNGQSSKIRLSLVTVDISIGKNPAQRVGNSVPGFLLNAGEAVAEKPVSMARIYTSIAILVTTSFIACAMTYSSVRGTIVAIGRNPLGKKIILRSMFKIILLAFIIFISGLISVYLLLKL